MTSTKVMVAALFLLVYGSFVYMLNDAAGDASAKAARIEQVQRDAGTWNVHDAPPEYGRLKGQTRTYRRIIYLVNMSLMFLALYAGIGPFAGKALDHGIVEVSEGLREVERRAESARDDLEEAKAKLAKIDEDVEAIRERERESAEHEAERLREFARKEAAQIAEHAELSIKRDAKHMREELIARVGARAVDQALKGLEADLDDGVRAELAARMVEGLRA